MGWVHLGPKGPGPAASGGGDCPRHGSVQGGRDPPLWGRASGPIGPSPAGGGGGRDHGRNRDGPGPLPCGGTVRKSRDHGHGRSGMFSL